MKSILVLLFLSLTVQAAYGQEKLELTLADAVVAALSRNLSVEEERLLQKVEEAGILEAKGEFDPTLSAGINAAETKEPSITTIVSTEQETVDYDTALQGKIPTGTSYDLRVTGTKVKSSATPFLLVNPYYSSDAVITITQPLLKGFGTKVQKSRILAAETDLEAARFRAEHHAMELIDETARAYWELYFARGNLEAAGMSLRLAESTLKEVQAKIEAGTLAPVEIYKAEAEAAIREERFLSARKAVFDAEDTLRAIMNTMEWHGEIVPVEEPPEPSPAPALEGLMEDAFANRRDLKQADTELKSREIMRNYYKNQLLPELNVVGSAGLSGLSDSFGSAIESTADGDFYNWKVGLVLEIPIGNRAKKGQYMRAENEAELAELNVEQIKQQITVDVRTALRAVELARESVRASGRSRVASEKRLEAEEERFRLGMATLNDVLTFQQEYADAISSEKRAIADYASASVSLRRASGTLLWPHED
jgi:outer membrane protein TolC